MSTCLLSVSVERSVRFRIKPMYNIELSEISFLCKLFIRKYQKRSFSNINIEIHDW